MFLANLNHQNLSGMSKYQSSDNRTKYSFFDTMTWPILRVDLNMADFSLAYPNHQVLSTMSKYPSVKVAVKVWEGEGTGRRWETSTPSSHSGARVQRWNQKRKLYQKHKEWYEKPWSGRDLVGFDKHWA